MTPTDQTLQPDSFKHGEPTRLMTDVIKIDRSETGLKGALYLHVDRNRAGKIVEVTISNPGKFRDTQMDVVMDAISAAVTRAVGD